MNTHDQEQVDKLKQWWAQNGISVCLGLGLGVSAVLGWRLWDARTDRRAAEASEIYEDLREAIAETTEEDAEVPRKDEALLKVLHDEYPKTAYAGLGALQLAYREVGEGRLVAARGHLEWVVEHTADESLRHLARMRLTRILLALRSLEEAAQLLQESAAHAERSAMYQELLGDLQSLRENAEAAADAYRKAYLIALEHNETYLPWLRIKLQSLGIEPEDLELQAQEDAAAEARG